MILKLSAENLDLKHQVSAISAQLTTFQSSMATQSGALTAQIVNMPQQIARASRTGTAAAASPFLQPTTTTPPKPATKPTMLKLTLQKKAPQI